MSTPESRSEQSGYGTPSSSVGPHSSTDSPPLGLQSEELNIEAIRKAIREEVTRALQRQKRGVSVPVTIGIVLGTIAITLGSTIAVKKVYGDEPIPEPTPASRGIGSVPGLTNSEVPQLQGLPPHLQNPTFNQKPTNPVNPAEVSNNAPQSVAEKETKKVNPEKVFDNTATSGVRMIERLPQVEIDRLYPTAFGKLREDSRETLVVTPQTNNLLQEKDRFPDKVTIIRDDGGILQLQYILDVSESKDPNAVVRIVKNIDGSIRFFNVPDGTTILSPNDGFLIVQRSDIPDDARPSNGDADTYGVLIDFVGMGNQYRIGIVGSTTAKGGKPGYEQTAFVFKNLTRASITSLKELKEYNAKPIGTYGIKIKRGDSLLKVVNSSRNKSPVEVGIKIFSALKITDDQKARPIRNPFVQAEIEFLTLDGTFLLPQKKPVD